MLKTEPPAAPYATAVAACVAERLKTLGHPADLVTPGALDALMEHASGSIPRLRAALASTIFLAATEDAPHIEREHVERAVENLGVVPQAGDTRAPMSLPRGRWAMPLIAALLVGATAAGVIFVANHGEAGPPPAPAVDPARVLTPAPDTSHMVPASPSPAVATPAPMPPAIALRDPPLPPPLAQSSRPATAPPLALRAPPPAVLTTIVLRYRQGDRWALDKLSAASDSLRQAGFSRIYAYPWHGRRPAAPVGYFFPGDRSAAQSVAAVFSRAQLIGGAQRHAPIQVLAERRPAITPHPPGTIEAVLP